MRCRRIYATADGESHFERINFPTTERPAFPDTAPFDGYFTGLPASSLAQYPAWRALAANCTIAWLTSHLRESGAIKFLHPWRDFSQSAILGQMSGNPADISKGYFCEPIGSSNPLWSASKSLILNEKIYSPELCRNFRRLATELRELATARANSSRFLRPPEAFSQNATLPVAFSANDGAKSCYQRLTSHLCDCFPLRGSRRRSRGAGVARAP